MSSRNLTKSVAAGVAVAAVAIGGFALGNSSSSHNSRGTAKFAAGPRHARPQAGGQGDKGDNLTPVSGKIPKGWSPGTGTIVTGASADKAKAAALAAKVQGTVNRVLKLSDGSYVVHMFATSGPHHVFVSKDFKVTGIA
ncbi:MAG: hypothetical protein QOE08_1560 [Thermoleophilaceae bacterium]|jgi:hypothetical protein|nr:hypothetical protein [Thermoleophilaceae bacterium]